MYYIIRRALPIKFEGLQETPHILVNNPSNWEVIRVEIQGLNNAPRLPGFPSICELIKHNACKPLQITY